MIFFFGQEQCPVSIFSCLFPFSFLSLVCCSSLLLRSVLAISCLLRHHHHLLSRFVAAASRFSLCSIFPWCGLLFNCISGHLHQQARSSSGEPDLHSRRKQPGSRLRSPVSIPGLLFLPWQLENLHFVSFISLFSC